MSDKLRFTAMACFGLLCCVTTVCMVAFGYYLNGLDFNERGPKLAECYAMCVFSGASAGVIGFGVLGLLDSFLD